MKDGTTHVALDAHMRMLQVAMLLPGKDVPLEWQVANENGAIRRMVRKIRRETKGEVLICYEAGPCGYALQRTLKELGVECTVIAPSLIPVKPGERIKTDKRDARKLVGLFRAGLLTEVHPPTPGEEAIRDLSRCREDAKADLVRARHRLSKMLLRRAITWNGGKKNWTQAYMDWLRTIDFAHPADKRVFDDYLLAIEHLNVRIKELVSALEAAAQEDTYRERVAALRCFQGINTVTAITVVAELHDFRRFKSPRELMGYLGLVPSEHSSADSRRQGSITKAGNGHARRVLIESSWHYRHRPRVGPQLQIRRKGQARSVIAIADKAAVRLYKKFSRLDARGKPRPKIVVAVARELVGFLWAVLYPAPAKAS